MRYILPLLTFFALPAHAQLAAPNIGDATCFGTDPDWSMKITGNTATLDYVRPSELTLMLTTSPEGLLWPQAFTFIGRGDSAIVIREQPRADQSGDVRVLTQRGETPLLLIGSCTSN